MPLMEVSRHGTTADYLPAKSSTGVGVPTWSEKIAGMFLRVGVSVPDSAFEGIGRKVDKVARKIHKFLIRRQSQIYLMRSPEHVPDIYPQRAEASSWMNSIQPVVTAGRSTYSTDPPASTRLRSALDQ